MHSITRIVHNVYKWIYQAYRTGIQLSPDIIQLNSVFFADDLALLADTPVGLQRLLNALSDFCLQFKLKVNINKTKILVSRMVALCHSMNQSSERPFRRESLKLWRIHLNQ